jgi:hypothetical protein
MGIWFDRFRLAAKGIRNRHERKVPPENLIDVRIDKQIFISRLSDTNLDRLLDVFEVSERD